MKATTQIEFRGYEPGDEAAILATFNLTFREVCGEGYQDRTLEQWRWEFENNPAGRRILLGMAEDGRVACQYAGVPIRVWASADGGRELSFFHAVDSMVHPDFRKGLRKRSLFIDVAELFFERYGGKDDHLGFGYPVRPAWRIGERYLGYRLIRNLDFLRRPCGGPLEDLPIRVERVDRFSADVDALFERLRDRFECITIKDSTYLNWRYADCPNHAYLLLQAMRGGLLAGIAVVRSEGGLAPNSATIGDLLVDPVDGEALHALISWADRFAGDMGCRHLMTVENPQLPIGQAYERLGFEREPSAEWLERKLGSRDWTSGLSQEWLAAHWSYALGDSDLF